MQIQMDVLIIWNSLCISLSTFYLVFKLRRDMGKLMQEVGEIKMMLALEHENKIIISDKLEF